MSLGIVLAPYGKIPGGYSPYAIDYDYKGATDWFGSNSAGDKPGVTDARGNMDPRLDPRFNERGEAGYYYDTSLGRTVSLKGLGRALGEGLNLSPNVVAGISTLGAIGGGVFGYKRAGKKKFWSTVGFGVLGGIVATAATRVVGWASSPSDPGVSGLGTWPTDFQLATIRTYLPVESGWISTQQGYQAPGPWLPPHGQYPNSQNFPPQLYPKNGVNGLGEGSPATVDDVVGTLVEHNDRTFALALVSTTAVAVSALLGVFRTLKLIREGGRD